MADAHDRVRTPAELVVAALVLAGSLPLARLFASGGIVPTLLFSIGISATIAWLLRRTRLPAPLAGVVSGVLWFWFAGLIWYRGAMAGPIPLPGMFSAVAHGVGDAIHQSTAQVAPVDGSPALLTLISMIVWAAAWLADDAVHKLRHPLLAIGFVLPVFVFPSTLVESSHRWLDAALFIAASMAVLFSDSSTRLSRWGRTAGFGSAAWRPGLALRIGVVVTTLAVVISPFVPGYAHSQSGDAGSTVAPGAGGDRVALNPLIEIRPRLHDSPAYTMFTVSSPVRSYWRITALDIFNGAAWTAPKRVASKLISDRVVLPQVPNDASRRIVQRFSIDRLAGPWLPAGFEPVEVHNRRGVNLEPVTRSLVPASSLRRGQSYQVVSEIPAPTGDQLNGVTDVEFASNPALAQWTQYPPSYVNGSVYKLAQQITAKESTPFARAVALQDYLRSPVFTYDENVAAGSSYSTMEGFLFASKRGYCEQFASSMALMARMAGLPSRVAIGFAVGNFNGVSNVYEVTTHHAHAWVEIYFPRFGWLPFEPTPRSDGVVTSPSYASGGIPSPPPASQATASASPTPTASSSNDVSRQALNADLATDEARQAAAARRRRVLIPALSVLGILLLAAAALPGAASLRRRRRRRRAPDERAQAGVAYADFLEWCAAARLPRHAGETPSEYARRLAAAAEPAERALGGLAGVATSALWAPEAPPLASEQLRRWSAEARKQIAATLPWHVRMLPAVGWGWWRG